MKRYLAGILMVICMAIPLAAQEFSDYDWESMWDREEQPDFEEPAAPVPAHTLSPVSPVLAAPPAKPEPEELPGTPIRYTVQGQYYTVISDGDEAGAAALVKELELRLGVYNRLFHFDPAAITDALRVRSFGDKETYDEYVLARLGEIPEGAVYIHYSQPDRRELIIHRGSYREKSMIAHQAFIQYLHAFIPNPPAWIRDGFAIYFSTLEMDEDSGTLRFEENLAWLDTVKALGAKAPDIPSVLLADSAAQADAYVAAQADAYAAAQADGGSAVPIEAGVFQSTAWALVSFFLNSKSEDYFRALAEMFMVLSPVASAEENARAAMKRLTLWTDTETLTEDYRNYLRTRKTFTGLITAGQEAYAVKDRLTAEMCFIEALDQRTNHFAPYYYLGLLAFEDNDHERAESLYHSALKYGADEPLVRYALGLNAASAGKTAEAIRWLEQAAQADPVRYKEKAGRIISQLRS
jgi:tetratricopeptide (TPR) repeat protein